MVSVPLSMLMLNFDHSNGSSDFENEMSINELFFSVVKLLVESTAAYSLLVPKSSSYELIMNNQVAPAISKIAMIPVPTYL